jgi:hypothetical protein
MAFFTWNKIHGLRSYPSLLLVLVSTFITLVSLSTTLLFIADAHAAQVMLAWDRNTQSGITGYKVYYGIASGNYTYNQDVGNVTTYTVTGLNSGTTYYFVATDYTASNTESGYSNEVSTTTPTAPGTNNPPVANNGSLSVNAAQSGNGLLVATDADGNPLTYSIVASPSKGSVSITNATTGAYTYSANANTSGTDTFTFKANDGTANSNTATVTVTITNLNHAPVASAGTLSVSGTSRKAGTLVATDADGNALAYSIVASPSKGSVSITNATTGAYTYTANANTSGTDTFTFKANDGKVNSNIATVTVTITGVVNQPPVADAGPDQKVLRRTKVSLNGSKSTDPDDGIASYRWTQISGTKVTLPSATSVTPTFTAPNVKARGTALTFKLTVTDKGGRQSSDTCVVNVTYAQTTTASSAQPELMSVNDTGQAAKSVRANQPPTANAGPDLKVVEGAMVQLDGSNSTDSDDGIVSRLWEQTAGPAVTLSDPKAVAPTFSAPALGAGDVSLTFTLTVTDKGGLKATNSCVVNVTSVNIPPQASAGTDQTVFPGALVTLDGSASAEATGGIASYRWTQTSGPPVTLLTEPTAPQIVFTAPDVDSEGGRLSFLLTVTDNLGLQSTEAVTVNVNDKAGVDLTGTWSAFSHRGSTVSGSLAVQNTGSQKSGKFRTDLYVSEDGITPGQLLSQKSVKPIGAANTRQLQFKYSTRTSLKGKYIMAVMDSLDQISETNKENNRVAVKIP